MMLIMVQKFDSLEHFIFLQTSCCLIGSPRELYPWMHKGIINLTSMFYDLSERIISYSFKELAENDIVLFLCDRHHIGNYPRCIAWI